MSNQTSSSDLITSLELAARYLYRYGGLILVIIGNIGSILNITVFTQKSLRKNPCSVCFAVANIFDFLFINSLLLAITLEAGFDTYYTTKNIVVCHLCYYTSLFANVISTYCLILASIDRVLITSSNHFTRQRSTLRLTCLCIICGIIFWLLFHSPALIFTNITEVDENVYMCFYQTGIYLTFVSYYSIIKESSSILLLLIFGLWAVNNIRRLRRVTLPTISLQNGIRRVEGSTYIIHPKDRQFVSMVLIDIVIFSICSSTAAMFLTQQQITQYQEKSVEQLKLGIFLKQVCVFCLHIPFSISCYTNVLVSKAYRSAMKNVFSRN